MTDRGYWARLGLEGIEGSEDDHPLGFRQGTLENAVLPRLAVLLLTLTTEEQRHAFIALYADLCRYCRQAHEVVEGLRSMARDLKNLEDDVAFECQDLEGLRRRMQKHPDTYQRFDEEDYKRASVIKQDLYEAWTRHRVDWAYQAGIGRDLDRQLDIAKARKEKETAERQVVWMKEQQEKREASLLARLGVLYKTSPGGVDESIPKNVRQDMPAAEAQLVAMGFEVQVEGNVRCCFRRWTDVVVYGDVRGGSTLKFNIYRERTLVESFWLKDSIGDLPQKLESKLKKLVGKRATQ
jgi:hypothetical protein